MKTQKMSLANIQGKLSRAEMKQIMAGSNPHCSSDCNFTDPKTHHTTAGTCIDAGHGACYCSNGLRGCN